MIKEISWEEIQYVWANYLWPDRTSSIQTHSAMCFLGGHDMKNKDTKATFLGYFVDSQLVGVNSGHGCVETAHIGSNYRSRGLYVHVQYRGKGYGTELLNATGLVAKQQGYTIMWSYPKNSSWHTYNKAGFVLESDWHPSETGINAYASCKLE